MIGKHLNYNLGVGSCGETIQVIQDLSGKGQNNSIYYNQSDGKYYSYNDQDGYKKISGNSNESFKYQVTPSFFGECSYDFSGPENPDIFQTIVFDEYQVINPILENFKVLKQGVTLGFCMQDVDEFIPEFYENNSSFDLEYIPNGEGYFEEFSDLKYNFNCLLDKLYDAGIDKCNKTGEAVINSSQIIEAIQLNKVPGYGNDTYCIPIKYRIKAEYIYSGVMDDVIFIRLTIVGVEYSGSFTFDIPRLNISYTLIESTQGIKINGTYYNTYFLSIMPMGYRLGSYTFNKDTGIFYHYISGSGFAYYGDFDKINVPERQCSGLVIQSEISVGNTAINIFNLPLFNMLDICGYFKAAQDNISITLPAYIDPADNNPEIIEGHNYEYHIMFNRFILIDITNTR